MRRLTEKVNQTNTYGAYQQISNSKKPFLINNVTNKLGQIEDLEEILGMELLELFKEDFNIEFKRNDNGDIIGRSITFTRPISPFSSDN